MAFVLKMSNGKGYVEYYVGLSMRMQAITKDEARQFATPEAAAQAISVCKNCGSAFSEAFFDPGRGGYVIETSLEPV